MRHLPWVIGLATLYACAQGATGDLPEDNDTGPSSTVGTPGAGGQGGVTSAGGMASTGGMTSTGVMTGSGGANTTSTMSGAGGAPCAPPTPDFCANMCVDILSNSSHCGGCQMPCSTGNCVNGQCLPASTASSVSSSASSVSSSSSSVSSSASSSGSGGMGPCDPLNPAPNCGSNSHCVPQPSGPPQCLGPLGFGTQYSTCNSSADCADIYECVQTGFLTVYCMQWCSSTSQCPGILDVCTYLNPAVYINSVQWGVCYDGFP